MKRLLVCLFFIYGTQAFGQKKFDRFGFFPLKVCPSIYEHHWNVISVEKKSDFHGQCNPKMLRHLNEYMPDGTPCELYSSTIYCRHKNGTRMKICLGHAEIGQWIIQYNMRKKCNLKPYTAIDKLIPPKLFNCQIAGQSVMCLPKNFDIDIVFPGKKIKIVNVDCPENSVGFGDVDRVYCRYKKPVKSCLPPKFLSDYKGERVCKEIRSYFIHIWKLAPDFEFKIKDENKARFYHLYQKGTREYKN